MGEMSDFVGGSWDGEDEYYYTRTESPKTCRCCGMQGLFWGRFGKKWVLYEDSTVHNCSKNPLNYNK